MKYTVYHKSMSGMPSAHKDGWWYYEPTGYLGGDVYSLGYNTPSSAVLALIEIEEDEEDPTITVQDVHLQWGIADGITPDPTIFVDGPLGKSIDVYGYNSGDYWDLETGEFLGPDEFGIVPVWTNRTTGQQFPPHAKVYPHMC